MPAPQFEGRGRVHEGSNGIWYLHKGGKSLVLLQQLRSMFPAFITILVDIPVILYAGLMK